METRRLVIEIAENGFLVYVNQDLSAGTVRPIPYVFESIQTLQKFIQEKFERTEIDVSKYYSTNSTR
jgi:hypothetical protein